MYYCRYGCHNKGDEQHQVSHIAIWTHSRIQNMGLGLISITTMTAQNQQSKERVDPRRKRGNEFGNCN